MTYESECALSRQEAVEALYHICLRIEACGASVPLTNAVILASDTRQALSGDPDAAKRVLDAVAADRAKLIDAKKDAI